MFVYRCGRIQCFSPSGPLSFLPEPAKVVTTAKLHFISGSHPLSQLNPTWGRPLVRRPGGIQISPKEGLYWVHINISHPIMIQVYHYMKKKRDKSRPTKENKRGKMEMSITEPGKLGELHKTFWKAWEKKNVEAPPLWFCESHGKWKSNRLKWQNALQFAENLKIAHFEGGQLYKVPEIREEAKCPLSFFLLIVSLSLSNTIHPVVAAPSFIWLPAGSWHFLYCMNCLKILEEI